ncbi:MAG: PepSY-associated TM helix domain-containing protein [Roseibacillus sp.]|nr:PepSY-associated TM helix domain-containing protein [Roseibacillus sp.]
MCGERPRKKRRKWSPRQWHRYLGAILALPLLWLAVTGLLLHHQEALGFDRKMVKSTGLLRRYDQIPDGNPTVTSAGRFTISGWGGMLFVDNRILEESGVLVGAVARPKELVIATTSEVFVYDSQGGYLDRLGEESLPAVPIERIGLDDSHRVHLQSSADHHVLGQNLLDFETAPVESTVEWNALQAGPEEKATLQQVLMENAEFTWSRVITDLHSGSLMGQIGRFLVDLTGIAVIILTLFGVCLLFKRN